jgi:hypothetical protein
MKYLAQGIPNTAEPITVTPPAGRGGGAWKRGDRGAGRKGAR